MEGRKWFGPFCTARGTQQSQVSGMKIKLNLHSINGQFTQSGDRKQPWTWKATPSTWTNEWSDRHTVTAGILNYPIILLVEDHCCHCIAQVSEPLHCGWTRMPLVQNIHLQHSLRTSRDSPSPPFWTLRHHRSPLWCLVYVTTQRSHISLPLAAASTRVQPPARAPHGFLVHPTTHK